MKVQPTTEEAEKELTVREAGLSPKLRDWRAKLSAKAKQEKRYRFYSLYGLVSHPETLREAWAQVCANGGKPGVDGVYFDSIPHDKLMVCVRMRVVCAAAHRAMAQCGGGGEGWEWENHT